MMLPKPKDMPLRSAPPKPMYQFRLIGLAYTVPPVDT
jgi:hypothetical protein